MPSYRFTGDEDPSLLAAIFARTFELGKEDAGGLARPTALCLSVGGEENKDAPEPVVDLLRSHQLPVHPASACEANRNGRFAVVDRATGKRAWLVRISALRTINDTTVIAYSDFYVEPLFAAGWNCTFTRTRAGWHADTCAMTWIS